jgi:hypothetical protein
MDNYLEATSELESPKSYFYWSLLTTISAIAGKRVWVNRGGVYNLYPNIYTFLVSKRSGLRKGVPISDAKKLAYEVGLTRVIDGQNSIQGVLKELTQVRTVGDGHIIKSAEGFLISGEFASFILQDGIGFSLTTLTDLYDTQYHEYGFTKRLASQDELKLKAPCITGLFASNLTHFFDAVPKNAITGGFLARTFCIYEEKKTVHNALTRERKRIVDYDDMVRNLKVIAEVEGEMKPNEEAIQCFEDWYYPFSKREFDDIALDDTGTSERLGDGIWKVATLLALVNVTNEITEANMEEAIEKVSETFSGLRRILFGGVADDKNMKSVTMRTVVAAMLERPDYEIGRRLILRQGAGVFGVYDLDECVEHLVQAGMIKIDKRGGQQFYKLTETVIRRHLDMQEGKKE